MAPQSLDVCNEVASPFARASPPLAASFPAPPLVASRRVNAVAVARALSLGRLGLGPALVLRPGAIARTWIGRDGRRTGPRTIAVALGARDIALALGTLQALGDGGGAARPWLRSGVIADGIDCVATLRARRNLPALGVLAVAGAGACATVAGLWAQAALPADQPRP